MQHSGSIRHYSGRPTLRYDSLDPEWLDRAIAHLRSAGYEPYLLLEKFEVPIFRERFAAQKSVALLDAPTDRAAPAARSDAVPHRRSQPSGDARSDSGDVGLSVTGRASGPAGRLEPDATFGFETGSSHS